MQKKLLTKFNVYDKSLKIVGVKGTYLNIIKTMYGKPTTNIIFNDEKIKTFPLR